MSTVHITVHGHKTTCIVVENPIIVGMERYHRRADSSRFIIMSNAGAWLFRDNRTAEIYDVELLGHLLY